MGLFSDILGSLRRGKDAQRMMGGKFRPPFSEFVTLYEPTTQDLRTDAAFAEGEELAFLIGQKVDTKGWITQAQWHEDTHVMQLWTATHGPYDFPGIDLDAARVFAKSDSKGGWYWAVWKRRGRRAPFPKSRRGFGKVGVPTPLFKTVIRKK
jgi:hypothetical protein